MKDFKSHKTANIKDYTDQIQSKNVNKMKLAQGSRWVYPEMCKISGYLLIKV